MRDPHEYEVTMLVTVKVQSDSRVSASNKAVLAVGDALLDHKLLRGYDALVEARASRYLRDMPQPSRGADDDEDDKDDSWKTRPFEPDWASSPGDTIKDSLRERDVTPEQLATSMGETMERVTALLDGSLPIDDEMAVQLTASVGGTPTFWRNRERQYRAALVRLVSKEKAS